MAGMGTTGASSAACTSIMDRMGVDLDCLGDASERLAGF
jgi:hypothetical protein